MTPHKERITVSLDPAVAAAARAAVGAGHAESVSSYVESAIADLVARDTWLAEFRALTGGPPTPEYREWALRKLGVDPTALNPSLERSGDRQAS